MLNEGHIKFPRWTLLSLKVGPQVALSVFSNLAYLTNRLMPFKGIPFVFLMASTASSRVPYLTNPNDRKPWYQKAIEMSTLWRIIFKSPTNTNSTILKTIKTTEIQPSNPNKHKLRKCTSLKVATSFTRVCLCAPISSYTEVFNAEAPPRRSYSYPTSKPFPTPPPPSIAQELRVPSARRSTEGRRVFRGKSLTDDVLMRRFVIEEEAMMQVRRRNQMEIIRKRAIMRRKKLGPSPLSRMVLAQDHQEDSNN